MICDYCFLDYSIFDEKIEFMKKLIGEYVVLNHLDRFFWGKIDSLIIPSDIDGLEINSDQEESIKASSFRGIRFFDLNLIRGKFTWLQTADYKRISFLKEDGDWEDSSLESVSDDFFDIRISYDRIFYSREINYILKSKHGLMSESHGLYSNDS